MANNTDQQDKMSHHISHLSGSMMSANKTTFIFGTLRVRIPWNVVELIKAMNISGFFYHTFVLYHLLSLGLA